MCFRKSLWLLCGAKIKRGKIRDCNELQLSRHGSRRVEKDQVPEVSRGQSGQDFMMD